MGVLGVLDVLGFFGDRFKTDLRAPVESSAANSIAGSEADVLRKGKFSSGGNGASGRLALYSDAIDLPTKLNFSPKPTLPESETAGADAPSLDSPSTRG